MRFFRLLDDVYVPDRWHLGGIHTRSGGEPRLIEALRCDDEPLYVGVTCPGVELDFSETAFGVPVVRSRLGAAFEPLGGADIQRLEARIDGHSGFEVLNALRVVQCLDEERSEFIKWTTADHRADLAGQYRQVTRLKLNAKSIPADAHVVRISGWNVGLVVSEAMKDAMEAVGCRGADFRDITS